MFLDELSQVLRSWELLLPEFPSLELPLLGFLSALALSPVQVWGLFSPVVTEENDEVHDLEQHF